MKRFTLLLITTAIFCTAGAFAQDAQREATAPKSPAWAIKSNLLYDATATINLGAEVRTARRWTVEVPVSYNPWTFSGNMKWKHLLVQPELRRWTNEAFRGSFFGVHAHYAIYNVGALPEPPFSAYMNAHRFEGWLAGAGVSYGYRWNFSPRWGAEASLGVGYAYLSYDKYPCRHCGQKLGSEVKHYFGPTKAALSLVYTFGAKKKPAAQPAPVYVAPAPAREPEPQPQPQPQPKAYVPQLAASYVTPAAEAVKMRSQAGKAYISFEAGKSVIIPGYKNNPAELEKIDRMMRTIVDNPDCKVTGISIVGYASPDGTYATNMTVSGRRAAALKEYVTARYGFGAGMVASEGRGENWHDLDTLVAHSAIAYKEQILAIIRNTDIFDGREKKLMALAAGNPYREMMREMFPQLRRSDYEVFFQVCPFTVEKGKEVFKTRPGDLSLNEMFLIAQTFPAGSPEFNDLVETAARLFPASDAANLNAAAAALSRKEIDSALRYLARISVNGHDAAFHNNMAVLFGLQGQWDKAAAELRQAAGDPRADGNAAEIDKAIERQKEIDRFIQNQHQ